MTDYKLLVCPDSLWKEYVSIRDGEIQINLSSNMYIKVNVRWEEGDFSNIISYSLYIRPDNKKRFYWVEVENSTLEPLIRQSEEFRGFNRRIKSFAKRADSYGLKVHGTPDYLWETFFWPNQRTCKWYG